VRGEMSAKTTHSRSAKGPTSIGDCSPEGKFVTLENTGRKVRHPSDTTRSTHFAQSSKMGTVTKGFDARLANRPLLVFDFRALWRSIRNAKSARSQKLKMVC